MTQKARLSEDAYLRSEDFGGVAYVHARDRFFALDKPSYSFVCSFSSEWKAVPASHRPAVDSLAQIGVLDTRPPTAQRPYSGPGVIGSGLTDIPSIGLPLVVNVFATARCLLGCVYCHAADLMTPEMAALEVEHGVAKTLSTARLVPAMARVITGGDPLAAPDRALELIEALAPAGPLLLDTSGVGDFEALVPALKRHNVHVRVSLDSISELNQRVRPPKGSARRRSALQVSPDGAPLPVDRNASQLGAIRVLERCAEEGITATIQSVYSRSLDQESEWIQFYRFVLDRTAVSNWIIHVAIEGGDARLREGRNRSVLPSNPPALRAFVQRVETDNRISLRLTDTGKRPNSVFLVDSNGNLETEGFAKAGKLRLYDPDDARPDLVRSLFHYVDRFGHAARYLNWVDWRWRATGLSDISIDLGLPAETDDSDIGGVENEVKFRVKDPVGIALALTHAGLIPTGPPVLDRDEYYDNTDRSLATSDYVVRLRVAEAGLPQISLKGPRVHGSDGSYARIELEVPSGDPELVRTALRSRGYVRTWFLEKRRQVWHSPSGPGEVMLDDVASAGQFLEIEGSSSFISKVAHLVRDYVSVPESRNYAEIVRDDAEQAGDPEPDGAEFNDG